MFDSNLMKHRREIAKAIRAHKFEFTDEGIYMPSMQANIGGVMQSWLNEGDHQIHKNLLTTEGKNKALSVLVGNGSVIAAWRTALFMHPTYTPVAGLTMADFVSSATEFTDYDESTRPEYVDGTIASGSVSNSASKAVFTISTGVVDEVIRGAALVSNSAKENTTGTLLAISLFSSDRTINATDIVSIQYTLTLT